VEASGSQAGGPVGLAPWLPLLLVHPSNDQCQHSHLPLPERCAKCNGGSDNSSSTHMALDGIGNTWWIPTFLLRYVGRMKQPDIQLSWREKLTINGVIVFYIIIFGQLFYPTKCRISMSLATYEGLCLQREQLCT
jgi:hypothetical protein